MVTRWGQRSFYRLDGETNRILREMDVQVTPIL
jgi:hypothetical protein